MPYFQVYNLLKSDCSLQELLDGLQDISLEYGYLCGMAAHGLRENVEPELIRLLVLIEAVKFKIKEKDYA